MALPDHTNRGGRQMDLTGRPVLTNARDALDKAERFADLSEQTPDEAFESVIHGAYFAMFHAARAALLAVQGTVSTDHARVGATFAQMAAKLNVDVRPNLLGKARDLHAGAHHGYEDLTEQGKALRAQMRPFLALCAQLVEARARAGSR
jgi:uncharacterized protein (UPF0332 family)